MPRHVPPSRTRYEQRNPVVSARVPRDVYDRLKALRARSGKSLRTILREALALQETSVGDAYQRGFRDARKRYAVSFPCSACRREAWATGDELKRHVRGILIREHWAHGTCLEEGGNSAVASHSSPP